jgi:energy-coupling factor transporter ATP-binding protein EcfA2
MTTVRRPPDAGATVPSIMPLRIAGARYQYAASRTWVIDGLDLTIGPGEIVAVVGANDSGKSTLGLIASGLAPNVVGGRLEGSVELAGRATRDLRPFEAAQLCGVLFQNPSNQLSGTVPTVWEEVAFGPRNIGLRVDEIVARVEKALASLGIAPLAARDPARLSGGQAQLVALASVLSLQPSCLVLDEPTSQLDPEGTRLVGEAIRRLAGETGAGILLIEHKTGLLLDTADRAIALDGGRVAAAGSSRELLESPEIVQLGVDPPAEVRLRQALIQANLDADLVDRTLAAVPGSAA